MKITVATPKPRNPFVAAALRRNAGSHRKTHGAMRQRAAQDLKRELGRSALHGPPTA
jgi:hypothetical protein